MIDPQAQGHGIHSERPAESLQDFLDGAAAERIRSVLGETDGRRVDAARKLGIDRTTLYRLMRKYGIDQV